MSTATDVRVMRVDAQREFLAALYVTAFTGVFFFIELKWFDNTTPVGMFSNIRIFLGWTVALLGLHEVARSLYYFVNRLTIAEDAVSTSAFSLGLAVVTLTIVAKYVLSYQTTLLQRIALGLVLLVVAGIIILYRLGMRSWYAASHLSKFGHRAKPVTTWKVVAVAVLLAGTAVLLKERNMVEIASNGFGGMLFHTYELIGRVVISHLIVYSWTKAYVLRSDMDLREMMTYSGIMGILMVLLYAVYTGTYQWVLLVLAPISAVVFFILAVKSAWFIKVLDGW